MRRQGVIAEARLALGFTVVLLASAPNVAEACSVCFGNPDSPHTQGMNNAILFLLAVIVAVLVCFAAFFLRLRRLSRLARADHGEPFRRRATDSGDVPGAGGTNGVGRTRF